MPPVPPGIRLKWTKGYHSRMDLSFNLPYVPRIVCVLDILGFGDVVAASGPPTCDEESLSRVAAASIQLFSHSAHISVGHGLGTGRVRAHQFSDTLVLTASPTDLRSLLWHARYLFATILDNVCHLR